MNNCYECKYRKDVTGSAHSECTHPMFLGTDEPKWLIPKNIALAAAFLNSPGLRLSTDGEIVLELDKYGQENGWCNFPINFDPIWVKCNLPL